MKKSVWIGYDPREQDAFNIAAQSLMARASEPIDIFAIDLSVLIRRGLYQRPTTRNSNGQLWDEISEAPMSTQFAISRFFMQELAVDYDLVLFIDCDMMFRADVHDLFALADPHYAVQVVKHAHEPVEGVKMDGQQQTSYPRKNWSSVMLWNRRHPANRGLTLSKLNQWAGRALHGFKWLTDDFIGELPAEWNHLVGVNPPNPDAKLVHYTLGIPSMEGYAACEHAAEWWGYRSPLIIEQVPCPAR